MAVPSGPIVKYFDVVKNIRSSFRPCHIDFPPDSLFLQTAEEGFRYRIVEAVPSPTHAGLQVMRRKEPCPVIAAIL
jgi:hypothetical protein